MAAASLAGIPAEAPVREQYSCAWSNWMRWGTLNPGKRRALALLGVSDDIAPETRVAADQAMAEFGGMLDRARARGPMRDAPSSNHVVAGPPPAGSPTAPIARPPATTSVSPSAGTAGGRAGAPSPQRSVTSTRTTSSSPPRSPSPRRTGLPSRHGAHCWSPAHWPPRAPHLHGHGTRRGPRTRRCGPHLLRLRRDGHALQNCRRDI